MKTHDNITSQVTLKYSEQFLKQTARAYWWKNIGPVFPTVSLLLAAFVIYRVLEGDRSWLVGVTGAIVVMGVVIMLASYFVHLQRSLNRLKRMKIPEAILELGEQSFKVTSDVGSSEMQWSLIKKIWCFEHAWLFQFSAGEFMTIPTDGLSDQSRTFIVDRAKANGAKIDGCKPLIL